MATRNRILSDFASQVTSGSNFDSVSINSLLYPLQDGLSGQFITTNGSGTLSFIDGGLDSALVTGMIDAAYVQSRADSAYITGIVDSAYITDIVDSAYVLFVSGGGGGASVTTDTTAPVSPSDGDLWYDEESGFLFLYYTDTDTSQWVQVGGGGGGGGAGLTESDGNYYAFDSAGVTGQFRVGQTTTALGGIQVDPAGYIDIKNTGTASYINLYCEVNNAHFAKLQSGAHADYSGNATITLPTTTTTLAGLGVAQTFSQAQTFGSTTTFTGTASFNGDVNLGNATGDTITFNGTPSFSDITASGTVTAADFVSTSDRRLKDNIETITDPINKVKELRGVTFDKDDRTHLGVIAQEVEEIIPEVVLTGADGYKSVAYGNIVGLLIEAMKEQQTQIEELKKQLENR